MREQSSVKMNDNKCGKTPYDQDDTEDELLNIKSYNICTVYKNAVYFNLVI
jgi:hypothetical protein